jgi:hypothetical protein
MHLRKPPPPRLPVLVASYFRRSMVQRRDTLLVPRHTHPGIESVYVITGEVALSVKGQPTRSLKPGEAFQVPPIHRIGSKNGPANAKIIGTYVVMTRGKPTQRLPASLRGVTTRSVQNRTATGRDPE